MSFLQRTRGDSRVIQRVRSFLKSPRLWLTLLVLFLAFLCLPVVSISSPYSKVILDRDGNLLLDQIETFMNANQRALKMTSDQFEKYVEVFKQTKLGGLYNLNIDDRREIVEKYSKAKIKLRNRQYMKDYANSEWNKNKKGIDLQSKDLVKGIMSVSGVVTSSDPNHPNRSIAQIWDMPTLQFSSNEDFLHRLE